MFAGTTYSLHNAMVGMAKQPVWDESMPEYMRRQDGTVKGDGFLGRLKRKDGTEATEISVGTEFDGKEVEIPLLVPSLSQQEVQYLLDNPIGMNEPGNIGVKDPAVYDRIWGKAIRHAKQRMAAGRSPFKDIYD